MGRAVLIDVVYVAQNSAASDDERKKARRQLS